MSLKASISGIRGIVGDSLTPSVIVDYTASFAALLPPGDIILGRDSRPTGDMITSMVISVLNATGRNVIDIGVVPTPTVLFTVANRKAAGGIVITASHNPVQWNALKLINDKGCFLSPNEFEDLQKIYNNRSFKFVDYANIGTSKTMFEISSKHIDAIKKFIDIDKIRKRSFNIVIDTVNGAAGPMALGLAKELGCTVHGVCTEPTGYFSHPPEPTPDNLTMLSEMMLDKKADIGFAFDPDGDRLVIAGSDGKVLSEEYTLALGVEHYLSSRKKTDIVINLSTSRMVLDIAERHGVSVYKVPTGEIHVTDKLLLTKSEIGGEGNGGIIIPEVNSCRDALLGMAFILEYLACSDISIENISKDIPSYYLLKTKVNSSSFEETRTIQLLQKKYPNCTINNEDGIRLDFKDKWVLIRKSNTEPITRIFAEAATEEEARQLVNSVKEIAGLS